jgi:hypothetical protein
MPRRIWESTATDFHHFSLGNGGRQGTHKSDTLKKNKDENNLKIGQKKNYILA